MAELRKFEGRPGTAPLPRFKKYKLHEDSGQDFLWAVSYSDLLMVLMSFFIIFFDVTQDEKSSILAKAQTALDLKFRQGGAGSSQTAKADSASETSQKTAGDSLLSGQVEAKGTGKQGVPSLEYLSRSMDTAGVRIVFGPGFESLTLILDDNLFESGSYRINESIQKIIQPILDRLSPYKEEIVLTWIGHTDATPVTQLKKINSVIDSNLVLSNLRSIRAVEFTLQQGFPAENIFSQGAERDSRKTRSLSLRIQEKSGRVHP